MCMVKAYIDAGSERELLLEDVSKVEIQGKQIRVETLFGEARELQAVIREIDFQGGSIILEKVGS
ncbi:MAG: CooT family nickel-binding protein [Deltaproteobacteria bacterium]|nr:CooT family nickel-binding protein [Deltaproteobacteria bacterium]